MQGILRIWKYFKKNMEIFQKSKMGSELFQKLLCTNTMAKLTKSTRKIDLKKPQDKNFFIECVSNFIHRRLKRTVYFVRKLGFRLFHVAVERLPL